jgi:mannose-6-phosphate isomerase-like protein (cupin superfamily)
MDDGYPEVEQWRATVQEVSALPTLEGQRSVEVLSHGSMVVKYYAPRGRNEQTPHTRDELYVVARGRGTFINGDKERPFRVGYVFFVPAGVEHRFEDFTDNFDAWVITSTALRVVSGHAEHEGHATD